MTAFIHLNGVYLALWLGLWATSWPLLYMAFRLAMRHERQREVTAEDVGRVKE